MTKKGQNIVNDKIVALLTSQTAYLLFVFVLVADLIFKQNLSIVGLGLTKWQTQSNFNHALYIFELLHKLKCLVSLERNHSSLYFLLFSWLSSGFSSKWVIHSFARK